MGKWANPMPTGRGKNLKSSKTIKSKRIDLLEALSKGKITVMEVYGVMRSVGFGRMTGPISQGRVFCYAYNNYLFSTTTTEVRFYTNEKASTIKRFLHKKRSHRNSLPVNPMKITQKVLFRIGQHIEMKTCSPLAYDTQEKKTKEKNNGS